nr:hypothetical protein [Tanacetum cinerariifolium]
DLGKLKLAQFSFCAFSKSLTVETIPTARPASELKQPLGQFSMAFFLVFKEKHHKSICTPKAYSSCVRSINWTPAQPQDDASVNIVRESPSHADAETGVGTDKTDSGADTEILYIDEEQGKDVDNQVNLKEKIVELDQGQAGSDLGKTPESRPSPEQEFIDEDQARPNPFLADEHVIIEEPLSLTETLSSMKNLGDAYTIGDQFLNEKFTKDDLGKLNVEAEVVSMVTVPIYQASSLAPPLSTPIINLSPPKPEKHHKSICTPKAYSSCVRSINWTPAQPQDDASVNIVRESPSHADAETGVGTDKTDSGADTEILYIDEEQGKDVDNQVNLKEKIVELDQGQAGSDLGKTPESRPSPEQEFIDEDQARPNPFLADEHVIIEEPLSLTETLSSMKNLGDAYTIGDQFLNEKFTKDDLGKLNVEAEVVSMVTVPIYQASSLAPPLSTPIINLSPPKPYLGSMVFTLELHDLPHMIKQTVNEVVKEGVPIAFQAPLRDHFRELPEADMKEILHKQMFERGSYKSLPEHIALYEALKASMECVNRDEFFAEKDKSRKRSRDDQDPHPLPPDSDLINTEGHQLVPDLSKPLPLGGPPARTAALLISKLKAANSPDFGLEELVPSLWIESEYRRAIRSHMRILSVINIKTFERYGYAFLKEIVIRRADFNEYNIFEDDFKNLHPNDFKDLNIVIRKRVRDLQLSIESYHKKLNLTEPRCDALDFLFKEDYTIISKPMAMIYRDRNDRKKMLRENKVHKFSHGTLIRNLHKLDHMVKDFKLYQYNMGMEYKIWSKDDKIRSEEFMEVIERRIKIQRIFLSLERFVGGRLRDVDYRTLN